MTFLRSNWRHCNCDSCQRRRMQERFNLVRMALTVVLVSLCGVGVGTLVVQAVRAWR